MNLVRSELLKIRTTSTWWWLALGAFLSIALAFAFNAWYAVTVLGGDGAEFGASPEQSTPAAQAANIYTSGQYLGLMFVMLIGILMVTNEFFHQTATTTFLTTPAADLGDRRQARRRQPARLLLLAGDHADRPGRRDDLPVA